MRFLAFILIIISTGLSITQHLGVGESARVHTVLELPLNTEDDCEEKSCQECGDICTFRCHCCYGEHLTTSRSYLSFALPVQYYESFATQIFHETPISLTPIPPDLPPKLC